ncbi:MAG: hypothetical protein D6805_08005 [Planctomycetota bacterium]|nr:MAG: hypothetical protein D6805_08005 [Planctomycetota bacterium]
MSLHKQIAKIVQTQSFRIYKTGFGYSLQLPPLDPSKGKNLSARLREEISNVRQTKFYSSADKTEIYLIQVPLEESLKVLEKHFPSKTAVANGLFQVLQKRPEDKFTGERLAKIMSECGVYLFRKQRISESEKCFLTACIFGQEESQPHIHLGTIYQLKDFFDVEKSEFHLLRFLQISPNFPLVYFKLGELYLKHSRASHAIEPLKKYIDLKPKDPKGHLLFGMAKLKIGATKHAKKHLQHVLKLDENFKFAYLPLAKCYFELAMSEKALGTLRTFLQKERYEPCAYELMAKIYLEQGQLRRAKKQFKRCLKFDPSNLQAYKKLIELYEELGEEEKAKRMTKKLEDWKKLIEEKNIFTSHTCLYKRVLL